MNVEETIKSLLFKHDCVIVPDFGGFVAKSKPAIFHPMDYTFHPPSKKIGFNSNLTHTDGLLANEIAAKNAMSYDEANDLIISTVASWEERLEKGETIELSDIGKFSLKNGHLSFEADAHQNFSMDSFGLSSLKGEYIIRKEEPSTESQKSNSWISYAAAIGFALLVGGSSYFANEKLVQPQLSSVFPLLNANEAVEVETAPIAPVIELNDVSSTPNTIETETIASTSPIEISEELEDSTVEDAENSDVTLDLSVKQFQVIGGSFKVYSKAMEHQAKLKRDGYERAIIIGKVGNFYMVAFDTFHDEEEAIAYKRELEKKGHDVFMRP